MQNQCLRWRATLRSAKQPNQGSLAQAIPATHDVKLPRQRPSPSNFPKPSGEQTFPHTPNNAIHYIKKWQTKTTGSPRKCKAGSPALETLRAAPSTPSETESLELGEGWGVVSRTHREDGLTGSEGEFFAIHPALKLNVRVGHRTNLRRFLDTAMPSRTLAVREALAPQRAQIL